jgi:hypothetical protein
MEGKGWGRANKISGEFQVVFWCRGALYAGGNRHRALVAPQLPFLAWQQAEFARSLA